ncbi:MAG: hypothetical protein A2086_16850 [Spirochaetes bacterium GWD1_27_9]|nr:MAG: hypothetical protein A2Z98_08190 [Spirochaetes bacterium GWB1_27_13]OHD20250.1 MAG: hypothetical protein A2Y34_04935 [Spirochaetes bacterium GWC1_27_15]OHD33457.1 MAG: hypothetical protein A2086_16850 [Spirochaetes bacterium GWD1_27_9]
MSNNETKKQRFMNFIDQTLNKSCENILKIVSGKNSLAPLTLKIKIKDVGYLRYIKFDGDTFTVINQNADKIDCSMLFDKAKTLHQILLGKILPQNISLIGKYNILFFNEKSKIFTSIYGHAKNNYAEIIKGTRFTLKNNA